MLYCKNHYHVLLVWDILDTHFGIIVDYLEKKKKNMSVDKDVVSKDTDGAFEIITITMLVFSFILWMVTVTFFAILFERVRILRRDIEYMFKEFGDLEMVRDSGNGYYEPMKTSIRTALMEMIVREQKRFGDIRLLVPQDEQVLFSKVEAVTYPDKFVADV